MDKLALIKAKSIQDHIPYVRDKTLELIIDLINKNKVKSILEIGTAYGYSAYAMSKCKYVNKVITVEKNVENYRMAIDFLKDSKVNCINFDAFIYAPDLQFDLIFIDGPKSHQEQLVKKYMNYLSNNGFMIIDNIYLKKFEKLPLLSKNQRNLIRKVKQFKE
jgi:predicted O-methyltransferase YrrM